VRENGLEVTTIEDIRSGIETHGTGKYTISNISMMLNIFLA
jgi:hypothetical protein